jgi:hypothetical protein
MERYYFSPSARTATNVAEFIAACQIEPHVAARHLHEGYFEPWLRDVGRPDLAEAAARIRLSGVATLQALQQFVQTAFESQMRSGARRPASRQSAKSP